MGFNQMLDAINGLVWGPVMITMLVGTGLYLTARMGFVQIRMLIHSFKCISGKYDNPNEVGDVSHFKALAAALSATIGVGNIAGVATAIHLGGPGAIFWMWVTALVGMATKYTSCSLALHFREVNPDGSVSGGPMYFLERGFAPRWLVALSGDHRTKRWGSLLAMCFALFAMTASFGIGNMTQANSVVDGINYIVPKEKQESGMLLWGSKTTFVPTAMVSALSQTGSGVIPSDLSLDAAAASGPEPWALVQMAQKKDEFHSGYFIPHVSLITGLVIAVLVGLVILGGIKRIAGVASVIVPVMCVVYAAGALWVLGTFIHEIPAALGLIFKYAFTPYAAGGGAAGIAVMSAVRFGVARGVFSNEAGLGSAPMAHAAAKTSEMAREGIVAMLGPFIDTIVVCSMTALVILVTGAYQQNLTSTQLTASAFETGIPDYGHYIVGIGLCFFAFSTMISWSYYGDRCAEYLFGPKAIMPYRCVFVALTVVGAVGGLRTIWNIADTLNAMMAIPNLIGLVALSGFAAKKLNDYTRRLKAGEFD